MESASFNQNVELSLITQLNLDYSILITSSSIYGPAYHMW